MDFMLAEFWGNFENRLPKCSLAGKERMMSDDLHYRPSNEEINSMPLYYYDGEVRIIRSLKQWRQALPDISSAGILGFDTETRPTFRKGRINAPALIQLASANAVYLLQLVWLPFGAHYARILADPDIIKVGVSIGDDMRALARIYPFEAASAVDLGHAARMNNMPCQGLRTLAASLFGWRISKGTQCSNWNLRQLSARQVIYAATDAWIGRLIYLRMLELGLAGLDAS